MSEHFNIERDKFIEQLLYKGRKTEKIQKQGSAAETQTERGKATEKMLFQAGRAKHFEYRGSM